MERRYEGKIVLVTGAARGQGRAEAQRFAQEGADVIAVDICGGFNTTKYAPSEPKDLEETSRLVEAAGARVSSHIVDTRTLAALETAVTKGVEELGGLHAVINPAGILRDAMFHKMTEENWDAVINVHLRGTYNVCRATIEHFRNQESGAYVLYTSTSGIIGNIGQTNYGAAKMGIAGLSRIIAMEGARNNIRANALAPVAWTRMMQWVPVKDEAAAARRQQMAQAIRPDQPARLSVALVSEAAKNVSGQVFGASGENIILYSQPRPIQTESKPEGWTIETILSEALPAMHDKFYSLARLPLPPSPTAAKAAAAAS